MAQVQTSEKMHLIQGDAAELLTRVFSKTSPMSNGCWDYPHLNKDGYGQLNYQARTYLVHRLVFFLLHGWEPENVLHLCDNPRCCNPEHLEGGDYVSNQHDKVAKGRQVKGEDVNTSKLSTEAVLEIRRKAASTTQQELADQYGVHQSAISSLLRGKSWKHV